MNITNNKKLVVALTVLVIGTGLISSCGPNKKEQEEQAQTVQQEDALDTPTVVLVPVKKGQLNSSIGIPGELIPYQEVDVYAKINSYVKTLLVDIGSEVHKGQLLATLEAPEIQSQMAEAKSRIEQQQSVYIASKATYDRLLSTSKTPGTVSQNDLEQAEAKKNADLANVDAAKSAYKEVGASQDYLSIRAPFDGVVSARNVNLGAFVGAGQGATQPMFVIEDQTRLRLVVSVPESYTGGLNNKEEVTFTVRSLPNQKFTAKIKRLAGALDEKLRAERLEMDVYNKDGKLLPNMYADVDVPLPSGADAIIVPKTAVVTSTEKVFVIRINNNKAEWVDVRKGLEANGNVQIFGDLKEGDQLVKAATEEIRDGATVKVGTATDDATASAGDDKVKKDSSAAGAKK